MSRAWQGAAACTVLVMLIPIALIGITILALTEPGYACAPTLASPVPSGTSSDTRADRLALSIDWEPVGAWDSEQVGNAAIIVEAGATTNMPLYGWIIATATAMQESSLRNLLHGPDDSLGLFQQRPSQGWGTPAQLLDPWYAAEAFYQALSRIPGWQTMPLTRAAQQVQRSAYPDAYARWEHDAEQLVGHVQARLGITCVAASGQGWQLPLPAGSYAVVSRYGMRSGRMHRGVDLAAPQGTPILAAHAGLVIDASCTSAYCDRPGSPALPGCGWTLRIDHGDGTGATYCHALQLAVHRGDRVEAGQVIAYVGSTGNSSGNHLHFQVHEPAPPVSNDTTIDPVPFLAAIGLSL